jgi:glycosyltransferase involved in cell wall biosynthesis
MRILFLCHQLPHAQVAGGHRLVYERIKYLVDQGHEVGLASFISKNERSFIPSLKKILFEIYTQRPPSRYAWRRVANYFTPIPAIFFRHYSPRMMRQIGEMVEHSKYDLVISEFSEMAQYLHCNPYLPAVHKIISCHRCLTSTFEHYVHTKGLSRLLRFKSWIQAQTIRDYEFEVYGCADRILSLTSEDKFDLLKYSSDLNITIVPIGVDVPYFEKVQPLKRENIILMTGFFGDVANEDAAEWFLTEIWPVLRRKNPMLQFYIVGESPPHKLRAMARRDERVKLTGRVDDLRPYRQMARVLVCPVRLGAGVRTKCLEAMASKLPLVSTSLGMHGLPAENGNNCFVADTPELMVECIEWLLSDEELRERMAQNAKTMIETRFSSQKTMRYFEQILEETLAQ